MARKNARPPYGGLAVSLGLAVLMVAGALAWVEDLRSDTLMRRLIWPLVRLHGYILVGLAVGQAIEILGWTRRLAVLARPLFRFGHLGDRCGAAFTAAWFSGTTANAMLYDFFQEGAITKRQLVLTNLVNQLPAYFLHLPSTFFIVLPLTGLAGVLYYALTLLAALLRTGVFLLWGRLALAPQAPQPLPGEEPPVAPRTQGLVEGLRRKLPVRLTRVALYVVPIYVLVFVVSAAGGFTALQSLLNRSATSAFMPMESLSVVALSFVAEFTSGFAAAGALMEAGVLTVKQTVIALLIGNVLAFPVRALRHQLPQYVGIFAPRLGTEILLLGQALRVVSLLLVGWGYYLLG
jgi:hypothetical protein